MYIVYFDLFTVDTYLDVLGEYNKQQFDMEFYHEKSRQMEYRETSDEYSLQNRENFFHTSYNYTSRLPRSPRNSYGSSVETSSEGSYEGSLEGPPLPLKQQQHQQQPINFSPVSFSTNFGCSSSLLKEEWTVADC